MLASIAAPNLNVTGTALTPREHPCDSRLAYLQGLDHGKGRGVVFGFTDYFLSAEHEATSLSRAVPSPSNAVDMCHGLHLPLHFCYDCRRYHLQ
jgi:hypothetical protein